MRLGVVVRRFGRRSVLSTIRSGLMAEGVSGLIEAVLSSADIHEFPILRSKGDAPWSLRRRSAWGRLSEAPD
jgi:hypothetical protein